MHAGAASGGVWKTTDGGTHWEPIFDDQEVSSVSALAVASSDSNVVWAGTGETFIRSNISIGNGIYKSSDAGKTWKHMGLEKTGRIGRVLIDPRNPDVIFAAALGHCYGSQPERGVFRTTDGGETWERLSGNGLPTSQVGKIGIAIAPSNSDRIYALIETSDGEPREGMEAESGVLWRSEDGGDTSRRSGVQCAVDREEH